MRVELLPATDSDLEVVRNLVPLYVHDISEWMGWDCPESGRFGGCDDLPQYWDMPPADPRYRWPDGWQGLPFMIRVDDRLAGFALVRRLEEGEPSVFEVSQFLHLVGHIFEVAEFFVLRKFRGQGVGREAAHGLFDALRGSWEVRELPDNRPAQEFWRKVISGYIHGPFAETVEPAVTAPFDMVTQRFSSIGS